MEYAIRLEADIVDFHPLQQCKFLVAPMAYGTKLLGQLVSAEPLWIEDQVRPSFASLDRRNVCSARTMTGLATNPMSKFFKLELLPGDGPMRVTTEATNHFIHFQPATEGLIQRRWNSPR